jgi:hypothetical protein
LLCFLKVHLNVCTFCNFVSFLVGEFGIGVIVATPHFEASVRMKLTLPKVGIWSLPGLPKTQSLIAGVKTPRIEKYTVGKVLKCRCPKWPRMSHLDICSTVTVERRGGTQTGSLTPDH